MKYLVTGGAGFIGSHVCEALLKRGDFVACVDDFNDYYDPTIKRNNIRQFLKHGSFRLHEQDIVNCDAMRRLFDAEQPDKVVHLAARAGVRASMAQPKLYIDVNIAGTANLLELAREYKVGNFVFASSSSVYGERPAGPFRETDHVAPISPYGLTKQVGEAMCRSYAMTYGLPITCLRFFTVYGPRGRPDMAPYKFMKHIRDGMPIDVYGDGATMRDYTFVDDIVKGVLAAADQNLPYEIINLGNSSPVTLNDFIATIEKVTGARAKRNQKPLQPGDVSRTYADVSKAKELLGWEPKTPLEEGLCALHEYLLLR